MWRNDQLTFALNESNERTVSFDIDSNMLPVISVDTYQTFDGSSSVESELENIAETFGIDADQLEVNYGDQSEPLRKLSELALDAINEQLYDDIVTFGSVNSTWSPRFYNFKTDSFNTDITVNIDKLIAWLAEEHGSVIPAIETYAGDTFASCDGFLSFVPGALYGEERLGTLIWLGLHMYLAKELDWDTYFMHLKEGESEAYMGSFEITLDSNAWEHMVNDGVAERIGIRPDHADLTVDEWKAWRAAAESAFGSEDLTVAVPDLESFKSELERFVEAWVNTEPMWLKHQWQVGRATGTKTCERCGLLPLDDDDAGSPCEFWNEGK